VGTLRQLLRTDVRPIRTKTLAQVEQRLAEDPATPPSVLRVVRKLLAQAEAKANPPAK
jgi:hypothetical protein